MVILRNINYAQFHKKFNWCEFDDGFKHPLKRLCLSCNRCSKSSDILFQKLISIIRRQKVHVWMNTNNDNPISLVLFNPNSLNKGSCWILKDFYCSVTMLREIGFDVHVSWFFIKYGCIYRNLTMLYNSFNQPTCSSCQTSRWTYQVLYIKQTRTRLEHASCTSRV